MTGAQAEPANRADAGTRARKTRPRSRNCSSKVGLMTAATPAVRVLRQPFVALGRALCRLHRAAGVDAARSNLPPRLMPWAAGWWSVRPPSGPVQPAGSFEFRPAPPVRLHRRRRGRVRHLAGPGPAVSPAGARTGCSRMRSPARLWARRMSSDAALADPLALALRVARAVLIVPDRGGVILARLADALARFAPNSSRSSLAPTRGRASWLVALLFAAEHGPYWDVGLVQPERFTIGGWCALGA